MIPNKTRFDLWRIALIPIGVTAIFFLVAQGIHFFSWDYYFAKRFRTIGPGDSRDQVVGLLGNPDRIEKEDMTLPPQEFMEDFRVGPAGPPDHILFWRGRNRSLYAVGFDRDGNVATAFYGRIPDRAAAGP